MSPFMIRSETKGNEGIMLALLSAGVTGDSFEAIIFRCVWPYNLSGVRSNRGTILIPSTHYHIWWEHTKGIPPVLSDWSFKADKLFEIKLIILSLAVSTYARWNRVFCQLSDTTCIYSVYIESCDSIDLVEMTSAETSHLELASCFTRHQQENNVCSFFYYVICKL